MRSPIGFRIGTGGFAAIPALGSPGHVLGVAITPRAIARTLVATAGVWIWVGGRVLERLGDVLIASVGGDA